MPTCLIALGSNLGDRQWTLDRAVERLRTSRGIEAVVRSAWHATQAIGGPAGQAEFLNGAVRLETDLAPARLLSILKQIESELGRTTDQRWAPRTLDLDLLLYGQRVVNEPGLVVPHPRMSFRRFVLVPAAEVAPEMMHPTIGWTVGQLRMHLDVAVNYVAIAGPAGVGKTQLAEWLHQRFGGRMIRALVSPDRMAAPGTDPSGQAYDTEIRFLRHRAAQLDQALWTAAASAGSSGGHGSFVVSDFWFDQSLSYAGHWLRGETFERFRVAWQTARARIMQPKLLVALDAPAQRLGWREEWAGSGEPAARLDASRLRCAIFDRIRMPGHGPILWLLGRSWDECLAEAVAAAEAMR